MEEGTRPRPYALVYGPSVIPVIERALIVFRLLVVSVSLHRSRQGGALVSPLRWVTSMLLFPGLMLMFPLTGQSRHFLCLCCVLLARGGNEEEIFWPSVLQ